MDGADGWRDQTGGVDGAYGKNANQCVEVNP